MASSARGSATFNLNVRAITAQALALADDINRNGAYTAERVAKGRARVDTGQMRSATHTTRVGVGQYVVHNDVEHSLPNEFGREGDPGQPFMRPGMQAGFRYVKTRCAAVR